VRIQIIDNGSTDGTAEWTKPPGVSPVIYRNNNLGVSKGWNDGLADLFASPFCEHVLVAGNDTVLGPWTYSALLSYNVPFVSGSSCRQHGPDRQIRPSAGELVPHPDFSCFLVKKEVWEKVGPFDESMVSWASDCDFHYRALPLGIQLWKANVPSFTSEAGRLNWHRQRKGARWNCKRMRIVCDSMKNGKLGLEARSTPTCSVLKAFGIDK